MKTERWMFLRSLKLRIMLGVMLAILSVLWISTLTVSTVLRRDMESAISAQQLSAVSLAAKEVDRSLRERTSALEAMARQIEQGAASPQQLLEQRLVAQLLFNWGFVVLDAHGKAIASVPVALNRTGIDYSDVEFVVAALKRPAPSYSEPLLGKRTGQPIFSIAVPLHDKQGRLSGLLMGTTNLAQPNFLDDVSSARYGKTGDFFITAPKSRMFLASSDKRRVMVPGPPPGVNPVYDRYVQGYQGSRVARSSRGVVELSSSVVIPTTGWLMQSVLPVEEAFQPVDEMRRHLMLVSVALTWLAIVLGAWWLSREFEPLDEAAHLLRGMGGGDLPRNPLPVRKQDEIGQLAQAFNRLLQVITAEESKSAEHAANQRIRRIVAQVPGMVFLYHRRPDGSGYFPFASDAVEELYGVKPTQIEQNAAVIRDMLHPEDRLRFFATLDDSAAGLTPWRVEYRIIHPSGKLKWLLIDAIPEASANGEIRWYGCLTDITKAKADESELRIAAVAFQTHEGIAVTDLRGTILRVNPAFSAITGYSAEEAVGKTPAMLKSHRHNDDFYRAMWLRLMDEGAWQGEVWNRRKNGEIYPEWLTITGVRDEYGRITHYVGMFQDITQRKKAEDEIRQLAFFDPLTHLPNRRLLLDRLQQSMRGSVRSQRQGALLFLDLDNFKTLNDTKGHDVGDQLLVEVAARLKTCVRNDDTVARFGGDEFVILLENLAEQELDAVHQAEMIGNKVLLALNQHYMLGIHEYHGTPSIGITLFYGSEISTEELLKRADLAMYQAKAAGRNTLRFFDPNAQDSINARTKLEGELHHAIAHEEFVLFYQPQTDRQGACTGVEALIRWRHPGRGLVSPNLFIPLAEESGLILPIGHWVLRQAFSQLASWKNDPLTAHLSIAVNVSARQFHMPIFVEELATLIDFYGVDPARLKLEITESMLLEDSDEIIATMVRLRKLGVRFSLDDFGTGYSSLAYLKRLPLDQLKIDQSFVRDILNDANDAAICRAVIALSESLGLNVIAEGVETPAQWALLRAEGCHAAQGYLMSPPLPEEEFIRWLKRWQSEGPKILAGPTDK